MDMQAEDAGAPPPPSELRVEAILGYLDGGELTYASEDDGPFGLFAAYFVTDPIVRWSSDHWVLQSALLDAADEEGSGQLREAVDDLIAWMNGLLNLIWRGHRPTRIQPTYEYKGKLSGTSVRVHGVWMTSYETGHVDPVPVNSALGLAQTTPDVSVVLKLLARGQPEWIWFDLWRVWENLRTYHPDEDGQPKGAFKRWVVAHVGLAAWEDFGRSANDPDVSGWSARHGAYSRGHEGNPISPADATEMIKQLVVSWMSEEFGLTLPRP